MQLDVYNSILLSSKLLLESLSHSLHWKYGKCPESQSCQHPAKCSIGMPTTSTPFAGMKTSYTTNQI